jgi:hypothetical protein
MVASLGLGADASPPVDTTYRLDMTRVISRTFGITFSNLGTLGLVGPAVYAPSLLLVLLAAVLPLSDEGTRALVTAGDLADRLLSLVLTGGVCHVVSESLRGRRATATATLRFGFAHWGAVFVANLFSGVLIILGFFVLAALLLTVPVAVLEGVGGSAAVSRSRELTDGNRVRVLGIALVALLPLIFVSFLAFGVPAFVYALRGGTGDLPPRVHAAVQLTATLLLIPFQCLYAVAPVVAYNELREHREGVHVQELAAVFE